MSREQELDKLLAEYEEAVLAYDRAVANKFRVKDRLQALLAVPADHTEDTDGALADPDIDLPKE